MIFSEQIRIYGKHARIMKKYSKDKGGDNGVEFLTEDGDPVYIFDSMIQCFMVATMWGISNKRKAEPVTGEDMYATIFMDIINKNRKNIERIYHHMVLSEDNNKSNDEKIKNAFTTDFTPEQEKEIEKEITSYALGGLEIIDELFNEKHSYETITNVIYSFDNLLNIRED